MIFLAYLATTPHCWLTLQLTCDISCVYNLSLSPLNSTLLMWTICPRLSKSFHTLLCHPGHLSLHPDSNHQTFQGQSNYALIWIIGKKWNRTYNIPLPIISPFKIFNFSPFYCCFCGPLFFSSKHPSLFYHLHHATHTKAQHSNGTKLAQQSWIMPLAPTWHKFYLFFPQNTVSTSHLFPSMSCSNLFIKAFSHNPNPKQSFPSSLRYPLNHLLPL